jgi:ATP phosphoribosyltransferase regulatory subunit
MNLSKLPTGMRYYIGEEARLRRFIEDTAMSVFAGWSYEEILTPSVDYYDLFEQGMGAAEAQRSFRFTDGDGRLLSLRPDVTSSIARVAATLLAQRPRPLRLCYTAPVFRQSPPSHAEWRREQTQLGCELLGTNGIETDLEMLLLAREILFSVGLGESSVITINHTAIFNGLINSLDFDSPTRESLRCLIDTRDVSQLRRFCELHSLPSQTAETFVKLSSLSGNGEVLDAARQLPLGPLSSTGLEALARLWKVIEELGVANSFELDLTDVSSLDYYTGISFKIFAQGIGYRIGRGGRYDGLTANFGVSEPAVGFVLSLDSLTELLGRSISPDHGNQTEVRSIDEQNLTLKFAEAIKERRNKQRIRIESTQ